MTDSTADQPATVSESLGAYLRAIANALAAPDATADRVLAAARARDVKRGRDDATFTTPDARLGQATVDLTGVAGTGTAPGSVNFEVDDGATPIKLSEVADVFGAWKIGTKGPGLGNLWPAVFTDRYRSTVRRASGGAIFVRVSLSGDPADPHTRVQRILLRRDAAD